MLNKLRGLDNMDKFVFLLGIMSLVRIRIVGTITVAEILLLSMYIFYPSFAFIRNKNTKLLFAFACLWLLGCVFSNIYNNSTDINFVKGVFFILLFILLIPPVYNLVNGKPQRILIFLLGYGISQLISPYFASDVNMANSLSSDVYFYYRCLAVIYSLGFCLYYIGHQKTGLLLCYFFACYGLFNMARNPFLTGSLAVLVILSCRNILIGNSDNMITEYKLKIPKLFLTLFIALISVNFVYKSLVVKGFFGDDAKKKYIIQSARGGVLEGGRGETFMGIELIRRNPIIGYGSYAKDKNHKFYLWYYNKHGYFYKENSFQKDPYLPSHSHIVGAWVNDGILGGIFWLFVLFTCWKIFYSGCLLYESNLLCLLFFQLCDLIWRVFFSVFAERVPTLIFLITLFVIYDKMKTGLYNSEIVER